MAASKINRDVGLLLARQFKNIVMLNSNITEVERQGIASRRDMFVAFGFLVYSEPWYMFKQSKSIQVGCGDNPYNRKLITRYHKDKIKVNAAKISVALMGGELTEREIRESSGLAHNDWWCSLGYLLFIGAIEGSVTSKRFTSYRLLIDQQKLREILENGDTI